MVDDVESLAANCDAPNDTVSDSLNDTTRAIMNTSTLQGQQHV